MWDVRNFNGGMQNKYILPGMDLLILTDRMCNSYKLDGGMRDGNRKSRVTDVTRRTATLNKQDRDKNSY